MRTYKYRTLSAEEKAAYIARAAARYRRLRDAGLCTRCGTEPRNQMIYCSKCKLDVIGPSLRSLCQRCKRHKANIATTGSSFCSHCRWGK